MDVNGMAPATTLVLKLPDFDCSSLRFGHDAVVDLSPGHTVDVPLTVTSFESEATINSRFFGRVGNSAES